MDERREVDVHTRSDEGREERIRVRRKSEAAKRQVFEFDSAERMGSYVRIVD